MRPIKKFVFFFFIVLLFSQPAFAALREIKVHAAVSSAFKFNPNWDRDIRDRVSFVNEIFEPLFGIFFRVEKFIPWEPQDETRETDIMMEEIRSFVPLEKDHVVVGFHQMSQPFSKDKVIDADTIGSAQFFRGLVIIRDPFGKVSTTQKNIVLAHEFAHLFGAVHIEDSNAIMSPYVPGNPSLLLDEDNVAIIKATRDVDFTKGIDSLSSETINQLIQVYEKLIRKNPHSDFYYQLGKFYEKKKHTALAVSTWEEAVKYHYDNPHIHRELGFHYYRQGRYGQAIQELGSAVSHFILPSQRKQKAQVLNFLGVAYYFKGNLQSAIYTWLQALTEDPDESSIQSNLALAYLEQGNVDRAVGELQKLAAKNMNDATTWSNLGAAFMRQKNYEKAAEAFTQAIKKKKFTDENRAPKGDDVIADLMQEVSESAIQANLGISYLELHRYDEAIVALARSKQLDPKNHEVYRGLAQAYIQKQQFEEAIETLQYALKLKQDDPYLYALLGQAYSALGKRNKSIQAARDGLRYAEGNLAASFHKNLSILYAQGQRFQEAMEEIRVSLNQNWNDPQAHFHLGNLQGRMGEFKDARRSFQAALRVDPNYELARQALDSLPEKS